VKRVVVPEMLDEDLGTPEEIRKSLLDLRGINQNFGGFSSMAALVRRVVDRRGLKRVSFLDVAGGTGDVAEHVRVTLVKDGIEVRSTVLDRAPSHMSSASAMVSRAAGDALSLPFADASFDVVGCNLFCHHLEPAEMLTFFVEALRVTRIAVIVSDLRRNLFHWAAAYTGCAIFRSRLTRNDAPASVRRAYTMAEIASIAAQIGVRFDLQPYFFERFGLTLWKPGEP
jgi:ubiquinone/menaquinone biosynthesis C-methylase UbiE